MLYLDSSALFCQYYRQLKMDNKDFKVSARELEKEFLCNVCFNEIEDCYITRCGHVYCQKCIFETINRHHRCPFCNAELNDTDVFKNYHFNTLRKILNKEKADAAQSYLDKVFHHEQEVEEVLLAPVQKKLSQNYKETLLTYRKYAKDLYQNLQKAEEKKAQEEKSNHDIKTSQQLIKEIHSILLPHLSTSFIPPTLITQTLTVNLILSPTKIISVKALLNALTPVQTLLSLFENPLKDNNCRLEFGELKSEATVKLNELEFSLQGVIGDNIQLMWNKPLQLTLGEGVSLLRNMECFTYKWVQGKRTNYYSCKSCVINWVCETCKDSCHEGHILVEQLKDNAPSWSCCYCVSKSKCRALNKLS